MNHICCIGEALIDMICTDKGMPLSQGEHFLKKAGGAPTNVAAAIAALGGKATLLACVGADPFGQHLLQVMESFGVDTSFTTQSNTHFTTLAFVSLMHNGERDFYFNRGADAMLDEATVNTLPVNNYSIIHFGSATAFLPGPLQTAYYTMLQRAMASHCFITFDPNYRQLLFGHQQELFKQHAWHYLKNCQFFKVSDEEALLLTATQHLTDAVTALKQATEATFAITLGKEGTLLCHKKQTSTIPSIPITPVDTTGAGDAFTGAVLRQLQQFERQHMHNLTIQQWQDIISKANKAGAHTCEYMGAMEAFRHLSAQILA